MKVSTLCSLTALAGCAIAEDAYLWIVDHGAAKYANTQASSISSETASSIIARRRGLLHDDFLVNADASLLREVKQYGGYQIPISGASSDSSPAKVLIRISGYAGTVSEFPSLPDLWIEDATKDLATDFKARKDVDGVCEYDLSPPTKSGVELVYSYNPEESPCMAAAELRLQPLVLALFSKIPSAKDVSKDMNTLMRTLSHLSVTENLETTLLVLPPTSKLQKPRLDRRADPSEEPLDLPHAAASSATKTQSASKSSSPSRPANTSHPLPKIVPQCFASQESCENTTNSCSGHGSCYKSGSNCYKCSCKATVVRRNSDGTVKTVQWGGNACQKKDISTEFILFASFGVVMAALIAGAIGAMYKMGSEELPSVIGAGVSGPKQK